MKKMTALFCTMALLCLAALPPALAEQEAGSAESYSLESIDLDLSNMSGTVVYAQIYQMALHPEDYVGKIIRLSGWFDVFTDSETGIVYTVCYIPDASSCCAQGVEFVWAQDHEEGAVYPEPGIGIVVTGRFETYLEGDWEYMRLADAELVWEEE